MSVRMFLLILAGLTSLPVVSVLLVLMLPLALFVLWWAVVGAVVWGVYRLVKGTWSVFASGVVAHDVVASLAALDTLGEDPLIEVPQGPVAGTPIHFGGIVASETVETPLAVVAVAPTAEVIVLKSVPDFRRVAARICCVVRLKLGPRPSPSTCNRLVAWELGVKACEKLNIRKCDIQKIVTRSTDMVFIPNTYDVLAAEMRRHPFIEERLQAAEPKQPFWEKVLGYKGKGLQFGGGA